MATNYNMFSSEENIEPFEYDFRLDNPLDNLFILFGTRKILRMFSPSLRNVPINGIEWSFLLRNRGYDEYGFKIYQEQNQN